MDPTKRFFIGGLGALAPVVAFLLVIDLGRELHDAEPLKLVGYVARVFLLFGVGGVVAWLHDTENASYKLFEIGIGAPALLAGMLSSGAVQLPHSDKHANALDFIPMATAVAQPAQGVKSFAPAQESPTKQFLEGLLGSSPSKSYYVISGSHLHYEEAKAQADAINKGQAPFNAQVYAPYGGSKYYAVVIGEQMSRTDAFDARDRAVTAGLDSSSYVWTPGAGLPAPKVAVVDEGPWAVVFGSSKLPPNAKQVASTSEKLGLVGTGVYLRDGSHRSLAVYTDRSAAEDALGRAKSKQGDVYLVDLGKWCSGGRIEAAPTGKTAANPQPHDPAKRCVLEFRA